MRTLSLLLIAVGFAIVVAAYALDPGLDLYITSNYFFDQAARKFWLADHPVIVSLRNLNSAVDIMIGAALAFGVPSSLAVVSVLTYRAFAFWLPTLPGIVAYFQLRRTVARWKAEPA